MKEIIVTTIITAFITTIVTGAITMVVKAFINRIKKLRVVVEKCFVSEKSVRMIACIYNDSTQPQFYSNLKIAIGSKDNFKIFLAETSSSDRRNSLGEIQAYFVEAETINPKGMKRIELSAYGESFVEKQLWIFYTNNRGREKKIKIDKRNINAEGVLRKKIDF